MKPADQHLLPSRANLSQFQQSYLKKSKSWATPDVIMLTAPDGARFVMKDWSARPAALRATWCRIAAARELRVYRRLQGMNGVPQLIARLDDYGFVMEWLDASPLPRRKLRDLLGLEFFAALDAVVDDMHSRGVAHGDLRCHNILMGADGKPWLIDFETAVHAREGANMPGGGSVREGGNAEREGGGGRLFSAVANIDRISLLKLRNSYFPESLTEQEQVKLRQVPWHLALGRFVRRKLYRPLTAKGRRKRERKRRKKAGVR